MVVAIVVALAITGWFGWFGIASQSAFGNLTNRNSGNNLKETQQFHFFTATTTSAISTAGEGGALNITGASKVTFVFYRDGGGGPHAGTTRFEIEVATSTDGTWYDFNRLLLNDVSATATSTVTIALATTSQIASMDLTNHAFNFVRCVAVEVTDGSHSCWGTAEFNRN